MWVELICGLVIFRLLKRYFYDDDGGDDILHADTYDARALFAVAQRLEKLYGGKAYIGLQIPDPDSSSRQNIDLVILNKGAAIVVCVKNISGLVSVNEDGSWNCSTGHGHKSQHIPDPVAETKQKVSILKSYIEQRGILLPEGHFSTKVICPNPNFRSIDSSNFPSEVLTYDQLTQLKAESKNVLSGWFKDAFFGEKKEMQESVQEKLEFVLSTAPMSDRLELKSNKLLLGEFLEFKGKHDDMQALRNIRRSKVSRIAIQKISMFGLAHSKLQLLYYLRDYRSEGSSASDWKEISIRSSTEVLFQPQGCSKVCKYKLSSIISLTLSA